MAIKKESLSFSIENRVINDILNPMNILNSRHLEFARVALEVKSKGDLAKLLGASTSTLDALYGVINRNVTLDRRVKIRAKLDEVLESYDWVLIDDAGIVKKSLLKPVDQAK